MSDGDSRRWGFAFEHSLQDSSRTDLPELDLLDQASLALGFILQTVDETTSPSPAIATALILMSVMGFRAVRASALLIASGYSSEAFGFARRIAEFSGQAEIVVADRTEHQATLWLQGNGRKPSRLVEHELWKELSPSSHADVRHLHRVSREELIGVRFLPSRFNQDWLACVVVAMGAKDLALTIHREAGLDTKPVDTLNREIDAALSRRSEQLTLW